MVSPDIQAGSFGETALPIFACFGQNLALLPAPFAPEDRYTAHPGWLHRFFFGPIFFIFLPPKNPKDGGRIVQSVRGQACIPIGQSPIEGVACRNRTHTIPGERLGLLRHPRFWCTLIGGILQRYMNYPSDLGAEQETCFPVSRAFDPAVSGTPHGLSTRAILLCIRITRKACSMDYDCPKHLRFRHLDVRYLCN